MYNWRLLILGAKRVTQMVSIWCQYESLAHALKYNSFRRFNFEHNTHKTVKQWKYFFYFQFLYMFPRILAHIFQHVPSFKGIFDTEQNGCWKIQRMSNIVQCWQTITSLSKAALIGNETKSNYFSGFARTRFRVHWIDISRNNGLDQTPKKKQIISKNERSIFFLHINFSVYNDNGHVVVLLSQRQKTVLLNKTVIPMMMANDINFHLTTNDENEE